MKGQTLSFIAASLVLYVILFLALADRDVQAVDKNYEISYFCSMRFKKPFPMVDTDLGVTRVYREESVLNRFFYPLELLFTGRENP